MTEYQLSDEAHWEKLIDTYQGNPLWLELTAIAIQDLFSGKISELMQCQSLVLSNTLRSQLERQWQKLTPTERAIMIQLNDENMPATLQQILKTVNLATSDVLTGIQSLSRRLLLERIRQGQDKYFQLNPVYQQYLKERSND